MFTRYNGVEIPKNYSGSRFRQQVENTETKMHRPKEAPPLQNVRKSVSPTFQEVIDNAIKDVEQSQAKNSESNGFLLAQETEATANSDTPPSKTVESGVNDNVPSVKSLNGITDSEKNEHSPIEGGIRKLLDGIAKDDLLLIALILMLAEGGEGDSLDLITMLALLLLFR